jgi:DNA-binding PadR family transcriptional regulator
MERANAPSLPEGAWIVLGFLLDGEGARSGYDLQAQAARSVADFWPVTKAHVYTALPRLEAAGFLTSQLVEQSGAPDKRIYTPTTEGAAAFARWLTDTDLGRAKLRHPILVKTFFGSALSPEVFADLLDRHEALCLSEIERYKALIEHAESIPMRRETRYRLLAIRHGIISLEAELAWIAEARKLAVASPRQSM